MLRGCFLLLSAVALLGLAGCANTADSVVSIDVTTGLVPGPEFRYVTIEVFDPAEPGAWNRVALAEASATYGDDYAHGQRVTEIALTPGVHRVTVRLLRADRRLLVALTKVISVQAGDSRVSIFRLTRDCVGDVVCPSPGGSSALTECLGGTCTDPRCEPPDPTYCPNILFCNSDADCAPVATCATSRCSDGICVEQPVVPPMTGSCGAGEYCQPSLGCTSLDTPADVETPECGEFCEEPCTAGIWICGATGSSCSVVAFKDLGVPCGVGGQCDGAGTCVIP